MFNKSVDSILGSLNRAINNLDLLISEKKAFSDKATSRVDNLIMQVKEADLEVTRAEKVKANIKKLLEV